MTPRRERLVGRGGEARARAPQGAAHRPRQRAPDRDRDADRKPAAGRRHRQRHARDLDLGRVAISTPCRVGPDAPPWSRRWSRAGARWARSRCRRSRERTFDDDDVRVIRELARRASFAVDNARLFGESSYIATKLQQSLLPPHLPEIPGVEIARAVPPRRRDERRRRRLLRHLRARPRRVGDHDRRRVRQGRRRGGGHVTRPAHAARDRDARRRPSGRAAAHAEPRDAGRGAAGLPVLHRRAGELQRSAAIPRARRAVERRAPAADRAARGRDGRGGRRAGHSAGRGARSRPQHARRSSCTAATRSSSTPTASPRRARPNGMIGLQRAAVRGARLCRVRGRRGRRAHRAAPARLRDHGAARRRRAGRRPDRRRWRRPRSSGATVFSAATSGLDDLQAGLGHRLLGRELARLLRRGSARPSVSVSWRCSAPPAIFSSHRDPLLRRRVRGEQLGLRPRPPSGATIIMCAIAGLPSCARRLGRRRDRCAAPTPGPAGSASARRADASATYSRRRLIATWIRNAAIGARISDSDHDHQHDDVRAPPPRSRSPPPNHSARVKICASSAIDPASTAAHVISRTS